jgi:hypothetical protein
VPSACGRCERENQACAISPLMFPQTKSSRNSVAGQNRVWRSSTSAHIAGRRKSRSTQTSSGGTGFPPGRIVSRGPGQTYGDLVARESPDILIGDDCESIGVQEMAYLQAPAETRRGVGSIIVPELGGFGDLPDSLAQLSAVAVFSS